MSKFPLVIQKESSDRQTTSESSNLEVTLFFSVYNRHLFTHNFNEFHCRSISVSPFLFRRTLCYFLSYHFYFVCIKKMNTVLVQVARTSEVSHHTNLMVNMHLQSFHYNFKRSPGFSLKLVEIKFLTGCMKHMYKPKQFHELKFQMNKFQVHV